MKLWTALRKLSFSISIKKFLFHFVKSPSNGHSIHPTKVWTGEKTRSNGHQMTLSCWTMTPSLISPYGPLLDFEQKKNRPCGWVRFWPHSLRNGKCDFERKWQKTSLKKKNVPENSANFTMTTVQVWIINKIVGIGSGRKMVAQLSCWVLSVNILVLKRRSDSWKKMSGQLRLWLTDCSRNGHLCGLFQIVSCNHQDSSVIRLILKLMIIYHNSFSIHTFLLSTAIFGLLASIKWKAFKLITAIILNIFC